MSAKRVRSSVNAGAQVFMMLFSMALDKDSEEKDIPVVKSFRKCLLMWIVYRQKEKLSLLSI